MLDWVKCELAGCNVEKVEWAQWPNVEKRMGNL